MVFHWYLTKCIIMNTRELTPECSAPDVYCSGALRECSMSFSVMRFEMRFQITQRVNPRAAAFAQRGALFGRSHRHFLEQR
jgi:hypothetical protein